MGFKMKATGKVLKQITVNDSNYINFSRLAELRVDADFQLQP
jgi:2-keto-4-pentenoate hydratase